MCGFVGFLGPGSPDAGLIRKLLGLIRHRGPDEERVYAPASGPFRAGFVRLSIIDIESGGQPVSNEDGSVVAIMNGEIYNYLELTQDLKRRGHAFRSHGDAEVLVHLYEDFGEGMLDRLQGMFAFLLWDARRGKLLAARDRLGIKPLYHARYPGGVAFSSEVKPLLALGGVSREPDPAAIDEFLRYQFVSAPRTFFKSVRKLRAGTLAVCAEGSFSEREYWDVPPQGGLRCPANEAAERILASFDDSVRLHLRSDVTVGAFLSGGIDSGLLVARAAERATKLRTYTLRFAEKEDDETPLAEEVALRYATTHRTVDMGPTGLLDLLPEILWACDEPLGDSGLLPNYVISRAAAQDGAKVVLNGAGGDELFAGYGHYFPAPREALFRRLPRLSAAAAAMLGPIIPDVAAKIRRAALADSSPKEHYLGHVTVFPPHARAELLSERPPIASHDARAAFWDCASGAPLDRKLYADIKTYLTDDLMLLLDRMTMAHSIEGRVPFLHHPFVEAAMSLPGEFKAPGGRRKDLLREIARPFLPSRLFSQPKRGFNSPIDRWVRGPLGDSMLATIREPRSIARPWWNPRALTRFVSSPSARGRHQHRLFLLFMLEMFCRVHLDQEAAV